MKHSKYVQDDGTEKLYTSPRQEGTYLYYTGRGDDLVNEIVGEGQDFVIDNTTAPSAAKSIIFGFLDDVFLKDGIIMWDGALIGDYVTLEVFLPANTMYKTPSSTGNFDLVDGQYVDNPTWTGEYLQLPVDYTLNRFVNKVHIVGNNHVGLLLESSDTELLSKDLRMRAILGSPTSNSNLKMTFSIEFYRKRTV